MLGKEEKLSYPLSGQAITSIFRTDISASENTINQQVKVPLEQHEFNALCSLVFNIGYGVRGGREGFVITKADRPSGVLLHLNANDKLSAADNILAWCLSGGRPILLQRRKGERAVFLGRSAAPVTPAQEAEDAAVAKRFCQPTTH
jgi:lysozyme